MANPNLKLYTTGAVLVSAVDFGTGDAGTFLPDSTGTTYYLWNDKDLALGSTAATNIKARVRDTGGTAVEVITEQQWLEIKSTTIVAGSCGGSTIGYTNDDMSGFQPIGGDSYCSIGNIPADTYRNLKVRVNVPPGAQLSAEAFNLYFDYNDPSAALAHGITSIHGDGVLATTGSPLEVTDSTGADSVVVISAGSAYINDNEVSLSGLNKTLSTGDDTYNVYVSQDGVVSYISSSTGFPTNALNLAEATISSGKVSGVVDKRVYLAGLQAGTTGAIPSTPDKKGDLYLGTNGKLYGALTSTSWTVIVPGATFPALSDTPANYTGSGGKQVKVTTGESALEFTTDFTDYSDGAMLITGGILSTGSSGATFKVASLTAQLRESSGATANLKYKTLVEQDNQAITAADTTYRVFLTYSTGDPVISLSLSAANGKNVISIGKVRKTTGDEVHFNNGGRRLQDGVGELHKRAATLRFLELNGGCAISYAGTNNLAIAAGTVYGGINRLTPFSAGAFTSTGTDTFTYVSQSTGASGWAYTTGATVIDYTHYDNGTSGLDSITASQYGCHWVYLHPDDEHVYVVYGRDSYKLAEAQVAAEPTIPDLINDFGLLLGCVIAPETGGSFTTVQMVSDTFFSGTSVATHNDLGGLDVGDYQHLTQAQHDEIVSDEQTTGATTGTVTIDWGDGRNFVYTRSTGSNGAVTFAFTAPTISADLRLIIRGSTAGSTGAVVWPAIQWQGGLEASLSSGVSAIDKVNFYYSTGLTAYLGEPSTGYSTA